jgi:hypothetical protein
VRIGAKDSVDRVTSGQETRALGESIARRPQRGMGIGAKGCGGQGEARGAARF